MRMLIVKQDTDLPALSGSLLAAKLGARQTDAALQSLQALNPHVDLKKLRTGSVLLVPDAPAFKTSATNPVHGGALDAFQQLVRDALGGLAERLKAGDAGRAAERAEVTSVLKNLGRVSAADPDLQQQIAGITKAFQEDQKTADQAQQAVAAAGKEATAALAALGKRLG
jgi:hypothetical protein